MSRASRFYILCVVIGAAAFLLTAGWHVPHQNPAALWNGLAAFAVLSFLSDAFYLKLRVGKTETQSSVAFIPFIASFLLFDSGWAAAVAGAAVFFGEFFIRRKPPVRILFNTSQVILSVGVGATVFQAMGGQYSTSVGEMAMPPFAVALGAVAYFLLNSTAVSIAVTLALGERLKAAWLRIAGASLVYDLASSPLGPLLAYLYARFQIPGILLIAVPLYVVRHIYHVLLQLEQVNRDLLELMVKAIEARDPYTSGHSQRVSQLAEMLAVQAGLGTKVVEHVRTAALLHDVGKIHEEYATLLRKEGKLDATERALMQTHAARSAELVGTISGFRGAVVEAVRHHHERYDGKGYPAGLAAEAIPIASRIIMIADTVDAMTTDRPYRKALSYDKVASELQRCSGTQFDPALVELFLKSASVRATIVHRTEGADAAAQIPSVPPSILQRQVARWGRVTT
jgi:putative nucleotidyltransferase with HDIG domain